jgi:multiple sugar transport system ATP-binding protein
MLELSGISKSFGRVRALHDVSLLVAAGDILAVTGPSGAGKSTLCRIVSGLEPPDVGRVLLGGRDVTALPCGRRRAAFMFESYALYPQRSVLENVASPLKAPNARAAFRGREQEIDPVLDLLEISHLANRYPAELSGGQKQRVALARALVQRPSIFLLDEPIAHLDAKLKHRLRGDIRQRLKERASPTIWTTPDGLEALSVGDWVAVIHGGRLEQIGRPEDIWFRPATVQVARLIGDPPMNLVQGRIFGAPAGARFDCPSFSIPLPGFSSRAGPGAVLGVRPDMISLHDPGREGTMVGEIYSHEPFGKYAIVTVRGPDTLLKIKTTSTHPMPIGSAIGLTVDQSRVSVFDAETGRLVASETGVNVRSATAGINGGT